MAKSLLPRGRVRSTAPRTVLSAAQETLSGGRFSIWRSVGPITAGARSVPMRLVLYRNRRKWRTQMQAFAALVTASLRCVVSVETKWSTSQGDRMEPDLPLFEVLQKPRDVEAVLLEGFLCKVADALRMRPVLIYQTAGCLRYPGGNGLAHCAQCIRPCS